ncbi:hypothetical protein [Thermosyntropha sp.]|uniref:hypothetical protein n=1 Tax=Thermosyntropha sp. TaxID=2740820 RepID=UPI0025FFA50B|nr:hypothetical protein [Thermosyntropha sp.]MBO8159031.1 hypothetical protein [Thermosyntropha sp.]
MENSFIFEIKEEIKAAFVNLLDVSCRQLMLLQSIKEDEDTGWEDELLGVLEEKDKVIAYIEELYAKIGKENVFVKEDPEIRELMFFIKQQEDQSRAVVEERLEGIGKKIKTLRQNEKVRKAYTPEEKEEGWFFDRRG